MKFQFFAVTATLAALAITGCASKTASRPTPHFEFDQQAPIMLDATEILFQNHYVPAQDINSVELDFPKTLSQSIGHWVNSRLVAKGDMGGTVTVTINEASVTKNDLPTTKGVEGWFTIDQSEKYTAKIAVTIEAVGIPAGNQSGQINAQRSVTVAENASLAQRENAWVKLTQAIMQDFDASAQRFFYNNMTGAVIQQY